MLGSARTLQQRPNTSTCPALLAALRDADVQVEKCLVEFERVTNSRQMDEIAFGLTRMNASQAILARRHVVGRAWMHIVTTLSPDEAQAMRRIREDDVELLQLMSGHIGRWTTDEVAADWDAFCEASREVRSRLRATIQSEKRLLYPLLDRRIDAQT
jgi:hypothetical protein